jgi:hypothetical protein
MLAFTAFAADPTGKWKAEMEGKDGQTMTTVFDLKADGEKLTGTVTGRMGETAISDGKITGDDISFAVVRERDGNTFKMLYKGKVVGDELKLTMTMEGRDFSREITAKKQ